MLNSRFKKRKIVMSCGSVRLEEPANTASVVKYKVKKNHTIDGPFISPNFFDTIIKAIPCLQLNSILIRLSPVINGTLMEKVYQPDLFGLMKDFQKRKAVGILRK